VKRITVLLLLCLAFLVLTPILAAALSAPGLLPSVSLAIAAVIVAALLFAFRERLAADFELPTRHPVALALFALGGLLAAVRLWGLAVYMMDPAQPGLSVLWNDPFYIRHNCFSAWYEAAVLAKQGAANVYLSETYPAKFGRFTVDEFLYPSPFLLLPRLMLVFSPSFFTLRCAWFALEAGGFLLATVLLARWIGGEEGRRVLFLTPFLWLATPILLTMQIGNFQLAALSLSMLALVAFDHGAFGRGRPVIGGALLGFACMKIFPGIVVIPMLLQKRWKDVAWTAFFGAFYTVASVVWMGTAPFQQFLHYELPRLQNDAAWLFLEIPELVNVVAINQGIPGLALKGQALGLIHHGHSVLLAIATFYTLIVIALALLAGFRMKELDRLTRAQVWLALTGLAALRSPFTPDTYALTHALWLWVLVMPRLWHRRAALISGALLWIPLSTVLPFEGPFAPQGTLRFALGLIVQAIALAFTGSLVLQRAPKPSLELIQETA
jgi:hypothetical protein